MPVLSDRFQSMQKIGNWRYVQYAYSQNYDALLPSILNILFLLNLCIITMPPNIAPINANVVEVEENSGTTTYPLAMPLRVRSVVCPAFINPLICNYQCECSRSGRKLWNNHISSCY